MKKKRGKNKKAKEREAKLKGKQSKEWKLKSHAEECEGIRATETELQQHQAQKESAGNRLELNESEREKGANRRWSQFKTKN